MRAISVSFSSCAVFVLLLFGKSSTGTQDETLTSFEAAAKHIKTVAPDSIPSLPRKIARVLDARHCRIPQDALAKPGSITNVIHASFLAAGTSDWAVVCADQKASFLLIFGQDGDRPPSTLASISLLDTLEGIGYGRIGYVRRITVLSPKKFAKLYSNNAADKVVINHDALSDAIIEKFENIYYWKRSTWSLVSSTAAE
jgi:hypothetical protein